MSKLKSIKDEMEARVKSFELKKEAIQEETDAQAEELGLDLWGNRKDAEATKARLQAEAQGRIEAEKKRLEMHLDELRAKAGEVEQEEQSRILAEHFDALHADDPHTPAQWAEAQARASFVKTDLDALEPADVVRYYLHCGNRGDVVGAYLAGKVGCEILQAKLGTTPEEIATAKQQEITRCLGALRELATHNADAGRETAERDLKSTMARIREPHTDSERAQLARELGVNVYDD